MITRKALRASALARAGKAQAGDYRSILAQGEKAFFAGKSIDANPYPAGTEDNAIWSEGWNDARETQ